MHPSDPNTCPECGMPLTNAQKRFCPACLMKQAFVSGTFVANEASSPRDPSPSPQQMADKFPQYEITECLGRGGMGIVYKARQKSLNRWVAIKILAPERAHDVRFGERFAVEAELLARLSHPHIVTIHDFGRVDGLCFLVMEFVDGVNLRDLLRAGRMEPRQALAIVPPVCDALQYAHEKGIVHRDIKPENLLLDRDGRVKIADFGIAALVGAEGETVGTPPYMAPEQTDARKEVDHRADIYALGVVLYEALTGERPGTGVVPPSKKVEIDVRLDAVVLRALEQKPERRYQEASSFKTQVVAAATQIEGTPKEHRRRFRWAILSAVAAVVGMGAVLMNMAVQARRQQEHAAHQAELVAANARREVSNRVGEPAAPPQFASRQSLSRQAVILDALMTLPPNYLADIPLEHRTSLVRQLASTSYDDLLDYPNGFLHWFSDSPEPQPKATSMFYLKVLPEDLGFGTVFVHMMKPRTGPAPSAANTAVLRSNGSGWEDVTEKVVPDGVDLTSHFQPLRASYEVEVAPYVSRGNFFDYGPCRQVLRWNGRQFEVINIAERPLTKDRPTLGRSR